MDNTTRHEGLTLLELLIAIAIIGILAAVLIPNLLNARETARERQALIYAQNVYKAGVAYVSAELNSQVVTGDCSRGYTAGQYGALDPGPTAVQNCQVTDADGDRFPEIAVTTPRGELIAYP